MGNPESFEDIEQQKEQAEVKLEEAKALQEIEGKQNQEIANYTEARDIANQLHGKLAIFSGVSDLFRAAYLKHLREIRDNKLYKHITVFDENGKSSQCGTFRDYCKYALKRSYSSIHEQLKNEALLGEAHDALKDMGVHRDQFRLMHSQDNDLLKEVTQAAINNDKDKVLEIIDDLSSKHVKEKEKLNEEKADLQKQLDEAQDNKEANDRFLETKEQKINELEKVVNKCLTPDEQRQHHLDQEQVLQNELSLIEMECTLAIDKLDLAIGKIYNHPKCSEELEQMPLKMYEYLLKHLVSVADEHGMLFDANQILDPILHGLINTATQDENG